MHEGLGISGYDAHFIAYLAAGFATDLSLYYLSTRPKVKEKLNILSKKIKNTSIGQHLSKAVYGEEVASSNLSADYIAAPNPVRITASGLLNLVAAQTWEQIHLPAPEARMEFMRTAAMLDSTVSVIGAVLGVGLAELLLYTIDQRQPLKEASRGNTKRR